MLQIYCITIPESGKLIKNSILQHCNAEAEICNKVNRGADNLSLYPRFAELNLDPVQSYQ